MHVTVLSMCSVEDKTCVIVLCSGGKKVEGVILQPLIYSLYDSWEEKPSERIAFDVKAGTIYSIYWTSTCHDVNGDKWYYCLEGSAY